MQTKRNSRNLPSLKISIQFNHFFHLSPAQALTTNARIVIDDLGIYCPGSTQKFITKRTYFTGLVIEPIIFTIEDRATNCSVTIKSTRKNFSFSSRGLTLEGIKAQPIVEPPPQREHIPENPDCPIEPSQDKPGNKKELDSQITHSPLSTDNNSPPSPSRQQENNQQNESSQTTLPLKPQDHSLNRVPRPRLRLSPIPPPIRVDNNPRICKDSDEGYAAWHDAYAPRRPLNLNVNGPPSWPLRITNEFRFNSFYKRLLPHVGKISLLAIAAILISRRN